LHILPVTSSAFAPTFAKATVGMQGFGGQAGWHGRHIITNFQLLIPIMKSKSTTRKKRPAKTKPAAKAKKPAAPAGMHTVTPHLVCAGAADAIEFYKNAFGAVEMMRLPGSDGKLIHASVRIGDSIVMLVDEIPQCGALGPKSLNGSPVTIHLNVPDVDATFADAVEAGAKVTMPVADMFWGARYGQIEDPFGHKWSMATQIRDRSPEEIKKAAAQMQMGRGR
jgi:uncharacterized glyoxalase superfamily protein PhnB